MDDAPGSDPVTVPVAKPSKAVGAIKRRATVPDPALPRVPTHLELTDDLQRLGDEFRLVEQAKLEWEITADSLPQLVLIVDEKLTVLRVNRTLERWALGVVREVLGRSLHAVVHPGCYRRNCEVQQFGRRWLASGPDESPPPSEAMDSRLHRYLRLEGYRMPLADATRPPVPGLPKPGGRRHDRQPHLLVVLTDVTELKQAEDLRTRIAVELERRVGQRTEELLQSNQELMRVVVEREEAALALRESQGESRLLSSQLQSAQERERKRIAVELHDSVNQSLSAIKFAIGHATQIAQRGQADAAMSMLDALVPMVQATMEEVRRISMDLRPRSLDDFGIISTLCWFAREFSSVYKGVDIRANMRAEEPEIAEGLRTAIFRITQEAVNNAVRHGRSTRVEISLTAHPDTIELQIQDNGLGFSVDEAVAHKRMDGGVGLGSMRERAEFSGASFQIRSELFKGTVVVVQWPRHGLTPD